MALPYIDIALPGIPPYRLMHVPGGEFLMGADEADQEAHELEKPAHRVHLDDFYIGRFPVTQDLWEAVMGNNPSVFKGSRQPVESVSWNIITEEFLPRLHEVGGKKLRLPTEAEWEYAARGGPFCGEEGYLYAGSDSLKQVGWYRENSSDGISEVGLLLPNALGLYDMSGNAWEWCADWYSADYYEHCKKQEVVHHPLGPEKGLYRILRGGSWYLNAEFCRAVQRDDNHPDYGNDNRGFRVALDL